jgi:hypothetical protein
MGFESNRIMRIDLQQARQVEDIDITRREDKIHKIFLDYTGKHAIVSMKSGDNYYLFESWRRLKLLSKLKVQIT